MPVSLLKSTDSEGTIIYEKLFVGDDLWENARNLFSTGKATEIVPVCSSEFQILYFAKYDEGLVEVWEKLCELERQIDKKLWFSFQHFVKHIHIKGTNDVLFQLRKWLISLGTEVSVEGEAWKIFGIEETTHVNENIVVVDEECIWIDVLYAEYRDRLNDYSAKLKEILCKPYIHESEDKERILFFLSPYPYFVDSIVPLILRYIQAGRECICVFPEIERIVIEGFGNIDKMVKMVEKLETVGGKCYVMHEQGLYCNEYAICFFCSEYSGRLPLSLRKRSRYVVALQVTALYTHMYLIEGKFEEVFSEQARKETDYLVASNYVADWICERDKRWDEKILRFGYPKLDTLYYALKKKLAIPKEWYDKIANKKVYLFTTYTMKQSWLEFFMNEGEHRIAIWRPHPLTMSMAGEREKIEKIREKYNIIIDDTPSYYMSFQVSDALIASLNSSLMINYLYTGKPICTYGKQRLYKAATIDYKQELWYKSIDNVSDERGVLEFIKNTECGESLANETQALNRQRIQDNFDGGVCNRIYDYFEKLKI